MEVYDYMALRRGAELDALRTASESSLQQGREEGREEGLEQEKKLLYRQINKRFGENIQHLARLKIEKIYSPKSLETIGDWIIDCKTGEEFMNNLSLLIDDKRSV